MKVAVIAESGAASRAVALLDGAGHRVVRLDWGAGLTGALRAERPDVCYPDLQGPHAEDGTVQGLLEVLGVPFAGPSSAACRCAWDKRLTAAALETYRGFAQMDSMAATWPPAVALTGAMMVELGAADALDLMEESIPGGYPLLVRPACGTGDAGLSRADGPEELPAAIQEALAAGRGALVQEWPEGVMLSVYVLGEGWKAYSLPPVEFTEGGLFPVQGGEFRAPVRLESLSPDEADAQAVRAEVERAALEAYGACGMSGAGRVDMVWDGARACILQVSPRLDLDEHSPFAAACVAAGLSVPAVVNALVGSL